MSAYLFRLSCLLLLACLAMPPVLAAPDEVPGLIQQLREGGTEARGKAAARLATLRDPRALKPLITVLLGEGVRHSFDTTAAIGAYGAAAVPPLQEALVKQAEVYQRLRVLKALSKTNAPAAVPVLVNALKTYSVVHQEELAVDLTRIQPAGLAALAALLRQSDRNLRFAVIYALGGAGPAVIPHLVPLLEVDEFDAGNGAAEALWKTGPAAQAAMLPLLRDENPVLQRRALSVLGVVGDYRAFESIVPLLNAEDVQVRRSAAFALRRIPDPRTADGTPSRAGEPLLALLQDADNGVRRGAAEALVAIGCPRDFDARCALLADADASRRSVAIGLLGKDPSEEATGVLLAFLPHAPRDAVAAITRILAQRKERRAVEPLLALVKDPAHPARAAIINALGQFVDPRIRDLLLAALGENKESLRADAAYGLRHYAEPAVIDALLAAYAGKSSTVRRQAARALGACGDPRALEALLKDNDPFHYSEVMYGLAASRDPRAQAKVAEAIRKSQAGYSSALEELAESGDPKTTVPLLIDMLRAPGWAKRQEAASALGRIGPPAAPLAVEPLLAALRVKPGPGAPAPHDIERQAIVTALGKLGDRRAIPALIDMLDDPIPGTQSAATHALAALTGQPWGYDTAAWRAWWKGQQK